MPTQKGTSHFCMFLGQVGYKWLVGWLSRHVVSIVVGVAHFIVPECGAVCLSAKVFFSSPVMCLPAAARGGRRPAWHEEEKGVVFG